MMSRSQSISAQKVRRLFSSLELSGSFTTEDDSENPAALPPSALAFLRMLCRELGAETAFEFGSGKSTRMFLEEGLSLTSIEDSEYWRAKTCEALSGDMLKRLDSRTLPLQISWTGAVPMMAWKLQGDILVSLRQAGVVLIDSPLYTGFRESVLCSALSESGVRLVVLDDARIPSIRRFCERIACQNPGLLYRVVEVGHHFALFGKTNEMPLKNRPEAVEIARGWRRFLRYKSFLRGLSPL